MSKCIPCSRVKVGERNLLIRLKKQYNDGVSNHYVFRLETNGKMQVVRSNSFNYIFEKKIKPNFKNGAEYFHISEFNL